MRPSFELTPVARYLMTLASRDPDSLADKIMINPRSFLSFARSLRIFHYMAQWLLDYDDISLPDDISEELKRALLANELRNALIFEQIECLRGLFAAAGIPVLFIKGSSGFIRGVYSQTLHYITDIDVLAPHDAIEAVREELETDDYSPYTDSRIPDFHHHIVPYFHPGYVAAVEVHKEPYFMKDGDISLTDQIWRAVETVDFRNGTCCVPSPKDHAWIVMRTNGTGISFAPRLRECIEILSFLKAGHHIAFEELQVRADSDAFPFLLQGIVCSLNKYFDAEIALHCDTGHFEKWVKWSLYTRRKLSKAERFVSSRKRYGTLKYLAGKGSKNRNDLFNRIVLFELRSDIDKYKKWNAPLYIIKSWRRLKNVLLYFLVFLDYLVFGKE